MKTQFKIKVNIDVTAEDITEATDKVNTVLYNALQDHKKTV